MALMAGAGRVSQWRVWRRRGQEERGGGGGALPPPPPLALFLEGSIGKGGAWPGGGGQAGRGGVGWSLYSSFPLWFSSMHASVWKCLSSRMAAALLACNRQLNILLSPPLLKIRLWSDGREGGGGTKASPPSPVRPGRQSQLAILK